MTPTQRKQEILDLLRERNALTVEEVCKHFDISPATVRRSFVSLAEEGLAAKTWGGIKLIPAHRGMGPTRLRLNHMLEEKQWIAAEAAALVDEGSVVFIDGGSTTFQMAQHLASRNVRIVTNSILVAHEIDRLRVDSDGAEVFLTGGFLYPRSGLLVGSEAVKSIRGYNAAAAFLSAGGIHDNGATNNHHLVVEVERAMLEAAARVYVLADHTKFGHLEMVHECSWNEIDAIITDKAPDHGPEEMTARLRIAKRD